MNKHVAKNTRAVRSQVDNEEPVIIDFGKRSVCDQNYSKVVALPKQALTNCGNDVRKVNVELVQAGTYKYLKLTPVSAEAE